MLFNCLLRASNIKFTILDLLSVSMGLYPPLPINDHVFVILSGYGHFSSNGSITSVSNLTISDHNWSSQHPKFTLLVRTIGGPPDAYWQRNGEAIESNSCYTITYKLDRSKRDYTYHVPYTARLTAHCKKPGKYIYFVTNSLTLRFYSKSIIIEGIIIIGSA